MYRCCLTMPSLSRTIRDMLSLKKFSVFIYYFKGLKARVKIYRVPKVEFL